ncbi:MAG: hypothetical protein EHM48_02700 [Planctomycetaceae bacterium]|nr:MAG: hypothetical protein EHM48_02700 [Planctomycetaceae bacterium]
MTILERKRIGSIAVKIAATSRPAVAGFCVAVAVAVSCGTALADEGATTLPAARPSVGRPDASAGPTKVSVSIWVADIDNIDSAAQSYTANVFIALCWKDSRLAHDGTGVRAYDINAVWDPRVMVANEIGMVRKTLPEIVEVSPDGTVTYRQRYVGVFSQPLRLDEFPLDSHVFRFYLVSAGYTPAEVEFVADSRWATPRSMRFAAGAGIADDISLPDWDIKWTRTQASPYAAIAGQQVAGYALEFSASRHRGYFYWKLLLPLTLIVLMSWLVFWIDPTNAGTQIGVATTAMLTLIAYRFAVDQSVPHVGYLTRMDYFVIGSSILVFLALCQVILTAYLAKNERLALALRIDVWSRIVFMLALVGLAAISFAI